GLMQTICLMALEYDLGTCIEGQGVAFPEILYEMLEIPEKKRIIMAIAIGYPNWDFPANNIETPREAVENITLWEGFKENTS
ncbi:MAG: nitroreductase, partial [Desulfobacteraceae bacterium]|nr:nitroreductase [Desulfobacteraceae bacterium]